MCQSSGTGCPLCRSCAGSSSHSCGCCAHPHGNLVLLHPNSQLLAFQPLYTMHHQIHGKQPIQKTQIWINSSIKLFPSCLLLQEHKTSGPHSWAVQILPEGLIYSSSGSQGAWKRHGLTLCILSLLHTSIRAQSALYPKSSTSQ